MSYIDHIEENGIHEIIGDYDMNKKFEIYKKMHYKEYEANKNFFEYLVSTFKEYKNKECIRIEIDMFKLKHVNFDFKSIEILVQSVIGNCNMSMSEDYFTNRYILKIKKHI